MEGHGRRAPRTTAGRTEQTAMRGGRVATFVAWNPFKKEVKDPTPKLSDVYLGLRHQWLSGEWVAKTAPANAKPDDVIAVLMEFGRQNGAMTLVAAEDGTASTYTGLGGGMIGMGFHVSTAAAAMALVG